METVCIDEFQNISEFDDPQFFQRKRRAHWQKHQKVSYWLRYNYFKN